MTKQVNRKVKYVLVSLNLLFCFVISAQEVPSRQENIPYLVTFGSNSERSWGDDDFSQTVFFSVPKGQTTPFYIRVFDPEAGGELDEIDAGWDTKTKYSIYGGKDAYSNKDARGVDPTGNYKSGTLLDSRIFGSETTYDNKWMTFGPFNTLQGEYVAEMDAYVFKVVIDGLTGNDGNLYKLALSIKSGENVAVEGANAFAFEYSIRLQMQAGAVAHVYPFADNLVAAFKVRNFDFDSDGQIKLYSVVKNGRAINGSGDNEWAMTEQPIKEEEKSKCLDLQIIKKSEYKNDIVLYITNEYNVPVPFFAAPIGGVPRYKYKIKINTTVSTAASKK